MAVSNLSRNRSFRGGGAIYLRQRDLTGEQFFAVGNADNLSFAINEERQTQRNFQVPGGGNIASQSSITDVTATLNALSLNPQIMAVALRGLVETETGESVTGETHVAYKDNFVPFSELPNLDETITVTDAGATETYVAGTDYLVRNNGIFIANDGTIDDADTIVVNYTSKDSYKIQAITRGAVEYEVFFDGFNEADESKAVTVRCHRVSFSPSQALSLITEDFGALPLEFEVLSADGFTGNESSYFVVTMEQ